VAATPDLMLGYVDFYLGGDEKRSDLPPRLHQRLPMCLIFGGDGSYMSPFLLHSDNVLTSLMSQVGSSALKNFPLVLSVEAAACEHKSVFYVVICSQYHQPYGIVLSLD